MESQPYQKSSDGTHEASGDGLELDLAVGTILAVNRAVGIEYASDERVRNHF